MAFIYKIVNIVNGKFYVGMTLKPLKRRVSEHISYLRKNRHPNKYLQSSYNKYGESNLEFQIVEEFAFPINYSDEYKYEYVTGRELYWIESLNPDYNMCREVKAGKVGRVYTQEQRDIVSKQFKGRKHTEESKEKIRLARAKQVITEKHKINIGKGVKLYLKNKEV